MASEDELPEVGVASRNRNPSALQRFQRGAETLAPGTFLPRVAALLQPGLYRERLDTNALVDKVFGEGGQLAGLAQTNPEDYQAIRDAANSPMQPREHAAFRSALLDMVDGEVQRKQATDNALADNAGYMRVFAAMDGAIPGINDPNANTYEKGERRQIQQDYERAQQAILAGDIEGGKSIMVDVRRRGDALSTNTRERMEQYRKAARIEDTQLYSATDNAMQLLRNAQEDLAPYIEKGERPPDFVLQKALTAYGAAGALQTTTAGDAAAAALGGGVGGAGAGMAGGVPGVLIGAGTGMVAGGAGALKDYFKSKKDLQALYAALGSSQQQVAANYASNRSQLEQRYAPVGIQFGKQAGEVYATIADAYKAEADKIPESAPRSPEQAATDRVESLRKTLTSERDAAKAAVDASRADAAANMPGAKDRHSRAQERAQEAEDNLVLFEDDIASQAGMQATGDAAITIRDTRARREQRAKQLRARDRQEAIGETLRRFVR